MYENKNKGRKQLKKKTDGRKLKQQGRVRVRGGESG
jgi:hypothetical protein